MTNQIKKTALLLALMLCVLTGCAKETPADYPALEMPDVAAMEMESVENAALGFSYPAEGWSCQSNDDMLIVTHDATFGQETDVNISVQVVDTFKANLDVSYRNRMERQMNKNPSYMQLNLMEMRQLEGNSVLYFEVHTAFTEESISELMKSKVLDKKMLEQLGGKEALLQIPPSDQIIFHTLVDDTLVIITGTYYEEAQKQQVLEAMLVMASTCWLAD